MLLQTDHYFLIISVSETQPHFKITHLYKTPLKCEGLLLVLKTRPNPDYFKGNINMIIKS